MIQFPARPHRGQESRSVALGMPSGVADRLAPSASLPIACLLLLAVLLASTSASAGRRAGVGLGVRGGATEPDGWLYMPVVLPMAIAFREHAAAALRIELSAGYVAVRPGLLLIGCTRAEWQCVSLEGSAGLASAAFETPERALALMTGAAVAYENRLPRAFAVRFEGELVTARHGGSTPGWSKGVGMGLYVLRSF
jgi:hypothetical protein